MTIKQQYFDVNFIKQVFKKALPLIIGTILVGLTNLIDNFMIGTFQSNTHPELSASSLAQKYLNISLIFVNASISMFAFLIFQYKGASNKEKIVEAIKILFLFVFIIDVIAIVVNAVLINQIMQFFQGSNYNTIGSSTKIGIAQAYSKILIFTIIPSSMFLVLINVINAYGKQKWIAWATIVSLLVNILFNYIFYKVLDIGLNGIAYSTILGDSTSILFIIFLIYKLDQEKKIFMWKTWKWKIDTEVLTLGLKRISMAMQAILWSSILMGIQIIYSNWYGDLANQRLAIVAPVSGIFYSALNGIGSTKGYFVGREIGKSDKEKALLYDKRINLYTVLFSVLEGLILIGLAFPIPLIWKAESISVHHDVTIMLIAIGATYPIAGLSKTLLGSLKVGGMGKSIILSNGIFALLFEFMIPFILFLINKYETNLNIQIWELYIIARCIKLLKLPPTLYFWKQKKWLNKAIK